MPRFHFHIVDGRTLLDPDGTDLPDAAHARQEALRLVGTILDDPLQCAVLGTHWRMDVTDAAGKPLLVLDLTVPPLEAGQADG